MPAKAAGCRIEPPVSVPVAPGAVSAATAAADPPDDPPGVRPTLLPLRRHGLITGPQALVSLDEPIANSSMLSLPSIPAPALRRLPLTVLSYGGLNPLKIRLPAVVSTPSVANRSLMPSGIPASGPIDPSVRPLSAASAAASASCGVSTV